MNECNSLKAFGIFFTYNGHKTTKLCKKNVNKVLSLKNLPSLLMSDFENNVQYT